MKRSKTSGNGRLAVVLLAAGVAITATSWALAQEVPPATSSPSRDETRQETSTGTAELTGPDLNVSERGTVELHVQGADLRRVLQLLSTQSRTNIIASKDVQGTVTADLYGVTFTEALDAVLKSAGFGYVRQGNFIYVYPAEQIAKMKTAERQMSVRVFKLNYITAADAKVLIAPAMSADGVISVTPAAGTGIKASKEETGGNALATEDVILVRDYPENLERIAELIKEMDARPQQVLVEATILRASLTEDNALGVDFNALAGIDFQGVNSTSGPPADTTIVTGALPADRMGRPTAAIINDVIGGTGGIPQGGLTVGYINNQIAIFVRALEDITDTAVLANPKMLVLNKQRGEVLVGRRDGYLTTTVSETTTVQTVEFLETGTKLVVRPYIMGDGYIRMEIHPEDSEGGLNAQGLPTEETTECTSNVLVKDGHTIVIGGLFKESSTAKHRQVPLIGNVPIVGTLFRRRIDSTERYEIIILITPHILKQAPDEIASEQLKDQVERFRIGMRKGMMWFGRDRLAQLHMRLARNYVAHGSNTLALWETELALSVSPKHEEAIRLKERLTRRAIWANEARESSAAYIVQKLMMQELGQPLEKVVPPDKPRDGMMLDEDIRKTFGIGPRAQLPLLKSNGGTTRFPVQQKILQAPPPVTAPKEAQKKE